MPLYEKLTTTDLRVVGESYNQNAMPAAWRSLPHAKILDEADGDDGTVYRLPNIANNLVKGRLPNWRYGASPQAPRERKFGQVTVSTEYVRTDPDSIPQKKNRQDKLADLRSLGPVHLDMVNRDFDIALASFLVNTTPFGAAIDITGTGANTLVGYQAANVPYKVIEDSIRSNELRAKQGFFGLSLEAFMPMEAATVLSGYEEYSHLIDSGDSGLRRAKGIGPSEVAAFAKTFAAKHGLNKVTILGGLYDSASLGLTEAVGQIFSNFLWIGFVDRRASVFDLTTKNRPLKPGGGLMPFISQEPVLNYWSDDAAKVDYVDAMGAIKYYSPQYEATGDRMGIHFNKITA